MKLSEMSLKKYIKNNLLILNLLFIFLYFLFFFTFSFYFFPSNFLEPNIALGST